MKKLFTLTILIFVFNFALPTFSFAQGMMGNITIGSDGHTAREETEGKEIWEKLQAEELKCENLTDDNFGALGEYFMGQMAGEQHEAMNNMMIQMMGEEGEEQIHVAMDKRMSGCELNAPIPQNMTNMMMGGGMMGGSNSMMGNFAANPTGWLGWDLGWVFIILFWGLIILAIVALIKWIMNQGKYEVKSKSALDILKERYAKGEIDKKEFEEKSREIKNL